jgi:hypothetical protein
MIKTQNEQREEGKMARIKILGLVVMAVMLLPNTATAQAPDTLWTKTYGGSSNDNGYSVAQTSDGGYIIAGETYSYGAGGNDVYLIKTDADGDTLWTRTYGGSGWDAGLSVVQTGDGGYITTGSIEDFPHSNADIYLIKTDANGNTLWTKTYGGSDDDVGYSVAVTSDGGYIIAGVAHSDRAGNVPSDVYLIKTDADGDTLWTRTYGGSGWDYGYSVAVTNDGGYIITGETGSYGTGGYAVYFIKTDVNGDTLWTKTFGGNDDSDMDWGNSVVQTSDGGYIIAGVTGSDRHLDVSFIKTDSNGDTLWTKAYGGSGNDRGNSVAVTKDGGYIIAGETYSYGAGGNDVYLIKTDADGDTLWTRTYGGSGWDYGFSVAQTSDGGYIITGGTHSYGAGEVDVYLIKLGPEGTVEENSNLKVENSYLRLGQNPFSRTTVISYQIPEKSDVSLTVYDITGKEIKRLVDSVQKSGDHHLQLDMAGYAEGVYFIKLNAGKFNSVHKVIVLR